MTTTTGDELRALAATRDREAAESFERCDTDGFMSQWASGVMAQKYRLEADIADAGGKHDFAGLYFAGSVDRVPARIIETTFGPAWLLRDDVAAMFGRKFIPTGANSRIQKSFGMTEYWESAPAAVVLAGTSGNVRAKAIRTGDKWGLDAAVCPGGAQAS